MTVDGPTQIPVRNAYYSSTANDVSVPVQIENAAVAGAGAITLDGPVPSTSVTAAFGPMMDSLRTLMPKMSGEKLQTMLLEVMAKIKDTIGASEQDKIRTDQESKRLALAEKSEKIKESEEKLAEASEKREKLSVWDKVKIAFQYIGAITAIMAGVLALATSWLTGPAGIVSGVLLIGAGVLLLGMAADATYVAANTEKSGQPSLGFIGEANKAVLMGQGMSEEEATEAGHKADTIARIVVTAVAGAMMLGAAIAGGVSAFQLGFAVMNYVQGSVGIATNTVAAASTAASASGDIASAVTKKDATNLEGDAKRLEGAAKVMQAIVAFLEDMIDIALTRLKGVHQTFEGMLDALVESANDSAATYARVGLRG